MRKLSLLAAILLLAPSVSHAKTLEELLVEKGVITKGEASGAAVGGASKVYWNNGTRLDFADTGFTTQINTSIKTRYTFTDNDNNVRNTSAFDVTQAKLIVSGTALNQEFSYRIETDLVGSTDGTGAKSPALLDAYLAWKACDWTTVKMGQFKTAISRQFNTGDERLQFADRSLISDLFSLGRQQGVSAGWGLMDNKVQVSAGFFNGLSDNEGINRTGVDTQGSGVASVRWNPIGEMDAFTEGDVDYTETPAVSLGASYAYSEAKNDLGAGLQDDHLSSVSIDANYKSHGASIHTELFYQSFDPLNGGTKVEPLGFYVQGGYFLTPKKWELAARYGYVDCDNGTATGICAGQNKVNEVTAGINYYWWKHNLKAQLNFVHLNQDQGGGSDTNTNDYLFQLSSYF